MSETETLVVERTLYDQLVDITNMPYDDTVFETVEKYKNDLVEYLDGLSDADWDELPVEVQEWDKVAAGAVDRNRRRKNKELLPPIDGLPVEDPANDPGNQPRRKRGRPRKSESAGSGKDGTEQRSRKSQSPRPRGAPEDSRFGRVAQLLTDRPSLTTDEMIGELESRGWWPNPSRNHVLYYMAAYRAITAVLRNAGRLID